MARRHLAGAAMHRAALRHFDFLGHVSNACDFSTRFGHPLLLRSRGARVHLLHLFGAQTVARFAHAHFMGCHRLRPCRMRHRASAANLLLRRAALTRIGDNCAATTAYGLAFEGGLLSVGW